MKLYSVVAGASLVLGALALPGIGQARVVDVEISTAPPPPFLVETTPPGPREGFIYEPAHYAWDGQKFIWVDAQFIKTREGHTYTPYVLERRGDRWHYRSGHWDDD
jgi:hypothetical protein